MLVPSSTFPSRFVAPTAWRRDSTRLVFPDPPWPTTATFLIFVGSGDAMTTLSSAWSVVSITRGVRPPKAESEQASTGRRRRQTRRRFPQDDQRDHNRHEARRRRARPKPPTT